MQTLSVLHYWHASSLTRNQLHMDEGVAMVILIRARPESVWDIKIHKQNKN